MRCTRYFALAAAAIAVSTSALAQFDGPAPLAWRWIQPTSVAPAGSPVVSGDMVYVAVGNRMYGLDRTTGNQRWKYPNVDPIPGAFRQGAVLVDNVLIASADNRLIYAVDAATGAHKWTYSSPIPFQGPPVVSGKMIVIALNDDSLMAINAFDGSAAWQNPYKVLSGIEGNIAANASNVYYMTGSSELVALSVANARQAWKARFTTVSGDATPVLFGDLLYVNSGQYVACLSAATGGMRWQQNVGEPLMYSPAVSADGVLVVSRDGNARIFDAMNGRAKVRNAIAIGSSPSTTPSSAGKTFVVPTANGAVNLINSSTGAILWSYLVRPIGGSATVKSTGANTTNKEIRITTVPASGPAVLAGETLFVLAGDGSLLAFDRNNGVDVTGPAVKMLWPSAGDDVSGQPPLELIFKIEDEATGVNDKSVAIKIDGNDMDFEFGRDGFAIVKISSVGKNKPLFDGRRVITVTATDWMGNTTKSEFALRIDNTLKPLARPSITGTGVAGGGEGKGGGGGGVGGGL